MRASDPEASQQALDKENENTLLQDLTPNLTPNPSAARFCSLGREWRYEGEEFVRRLINWIHNPTHRTFINLSVCSAMGEVVTLAGFPQLGLLVLLFFSMLAFTMLVFARTVELLQWSIIFIIVTFLSTTFTFEEIYESNGIKKGDTTYSHEVCQKKEHDADQESCRAKLSVYALHLSFATATTVGYGNVSPADDSMVWANIQMIHGITFFGLFTGTIITLLLRNTALPSRP